MISRHFFHFSLGWATLTIMALPVFSQTQYDLLIKGGHVIDAKNNVDAVRDVAIRDGKIAEVAQHIDPSEALKTVDASGLSLLRGWLISTFTCMPAQAKRIRTPATTESGRTDSRFVRE